MPTTQETIQEDKRLEGCTHVIKGGGDLYLVRVSMIDASISKALVIFPRFLILSTSNS